MKTRADLVVDGRGRIRRVVSTPPITFRRTADAVYLVGTAAGPLGDDDLSICVAVCDGGSLKVRSAAATMVYAGAGSRQRFDISVGSDATLDWHPEPVIATAGCHHLQDVRVTLEDNARLDWTEEVVLGRHGEAPGKIDLRMQVDLAGRPLLRHQLAVGSPGWDGPAVLDGQRAAGLRLIVNASPPQPGPATGPGWAWLELEGPAQLLVAYGADLIELRERTTDASKRWPVAESPASGRQTVSVAGASVG